MMLLFFGIVFFLMWYYADKTLGKDFNTVLKFSSLGLILIFSFTDVFLMLETQRIMGLENQIQYTHITDILPNITTNGNVSDLFYIDNILLNISNSPNNTTYVNYTGVETFDGISSTITQENNTHDTSIELWNGASWSVLQHITNRTNKLTTNTTVASPSQYIDNGLVQARIITTGHGNVSFDQLVLQTSKTTYLFANTTMDTETLVSYHYSEYWFIHIITSILPELAILIIGTFAIQYTVLWYDENMFGKVDRKEKK